MTRDLNASWIAAGESETLELKKMISERTEDTETLCAMLTQRGGRLFYGVKPNGSLSGQQVGDGTLEK